MSVELFPYPSRLTPEDSAAWARALIGFFDLTGEMVPLLTVSRAIDEADRLLMRQCQPRGPVKPRRVQLRRTKGWQMPPNTVKVDRSTRWGNPFRVHGDGIVMDAAMAVQSFRELLRKQGAWYPTMPKVGRVPAGGPTTVEDVRRALRGKNLACWCAPGSPCHADVLLEIANG